MVTSEINLYGSMKAIWDMCGLGQGLARCVYALRIDRLIASFIRYQAGRLLRRPSSGRGLCSAERLKRRRLRPTLERCNHHSCNQLLRQSVLRGKNVRKISSEAYISPSVVYLNRYGRHPARSPWICFQCSDVRKCSHP